MKKLYQTNIIKWNDRTNILCHYIERRSAEETEELQKDLSEKVDKILEKSYTQRLGESWEKIKNKYCPNETLYSPYLIRDKGYDRERYSGCMIVGNRLFELSLEYPSRFPTLLDEDGQIWNPLSNEEKHELRKDMFLLMDKRYEIYKEIEKEKVLDLNSLRMIFPKAITYDDLSKNYPEIYRYWIDKMTLEHGKIKIITVDEEIKNLRTFL